MNIDLKKEMIDLKDFALKSLQQTGEIYPIFKLISDTEIEVLLAVPWKSDKEKHTFLDKLAPTIFAYYKAEIVIMVSECWVTQIHIDYPSKTTRRDALNISGFTRKGVETLSLVVDQIPNTKLKNGNPSWLVMEEFWASNDNIDDAGDIPYAFSQSLKMRDLFTDEEITLRYKTISKYLEESPPKE